MSGSGGSCDVLVVGAGITGLCTAVHAAQHGARVTLLDARAPGAGASGRSGAIVRSSCDSECETLLALRSLYIFGGWRERFGGSCDFQPRGVWTIAPRSADDAFEKRLDRLRAWGSPIALCARPPARPALSEDEIVAIEEPAGTCDPNMAMRALADCAAAYGVRLIAGEPVKALILDGAACDGVATAERTYRADATLVAAGAWSGALLAAAGIDLPLAARLVRVSVFDHLALADWPSLPVIIDEVTQAWFRPIVGQGVLVGAERTGGDFDALDAVPLAAPDAVVAQHAALLARRFGLSPHVTPRGSWSGVFGTSPDGRPVAGAVGGVSRLFVAAGDSGSSFKYAPALGEALADMMLGRDAEGPDLSTLSPDRFEAATARRRVAERSLA